MKAIKTYFSQFCFQFLNVIFLHAWLRIRFAYVIRQFDIFRFHLPVFLKKKTKKQLRRLWICFQSVRIVKRRIHHTCFSFRLVAFSALSLLNRPSTSFLNWSWRRSVRCCSCVSKCRKLSAVVSFVFNSFCSEKWKVNNQVCTS